MFEQIHAPNNAACIQIGKSKKFIIFASVLIGKALHLSTEFN